MNTTSLDMVYLSRLGKVQVVLCYNVNACWLPLFLDRTSDLKPAGFYFGAEMSASFRISMSEKLRSDVLERDAFMCAYCDGRADVVDHIVPYAYCQNNDPENLVASCEDCNLIASDKIFESLSAKREYIRNKRGMHKWRAKLLNRYSFCIVCKEPFAEGHKNATHFICPTCVLSGREYSVKPTEVKLKAF